MDIRRDSPRILLDFLSHQESIRGYSKKTVNEYFFDLRLFFRFLKLNRGLVNVPDESDAPDMNQIPINDIDIEFIRSVTLSEIYDFLSWLSRERSRQPNSRYADTGLEASSRARKVSSIRSFFKYLTKKAKLLDVSPAEELDSPKTGKKLPKYLTLDESVGLLGSVEGSCKERDYCILTLFLGCGLRISELAGINFQDIKNDTLRITGKGNKQRIIYLSEACLGAIEDYMKIRSEIKGKEGHENALFLSKQQRRISTQMVHVLVKKHLSAAGLDGYSSHKLRHTAATLMLQNGVDIRTLQEILGHDHLNTTQIYAHIDSTDKKIAAEANPLSKMRTRVKKDLPPSE